MVAQFLRYASFLIIMAFGPSGYGADFTRYDANSYADVKKADFGTFFINIGVGTKNRNRDPDHKLFKYVREGQVTFIKRQPAMCLNFVHYTEYFELLHQKYLISLVLTDREGKENDVQEKGEFTPTDTPNTGNFPDYCFDLPSEVTEVSVKLKTRDFASSDWARIKFK